MRFAAEFKRDFELNDDVDEFNITFHNDESEVGGLIEFAKAYSDKVVNVRFSDEAGLDVIRAVADVPNVRFVLEPSDSACMLACKEDGVLFFVDREWPCHSFTELDYYLRELGVCAVYAVDDLSHDMENVRRMCKKYAADVRVILNRCPQTFLSEGDETVVFYRPQDMDVIERYFDVAEFDCGLGRKCDFNRLAAYHEAYFDKRDWYGDMRQLVPALPFTVPARCVTKFLAGRKLKCGCECKRQGRGCSYCSDMVELARMLADRGAQYASEKPTRPHATQEEVDAVRRQVEAAFGEKVAERFDV